MEKERKKSANSSAFSLSLFPLLEQQNAKRDMPIQKSSYASANKPLLLFRLTALAMGQSARGLSAFNWLQMTLWLHFSPQRAAFSMLNFSSSIFPERNFPFFYPSVFRAKHSYRIPGLISKSRERNFWTHQERRWNHYFLFQIHIIIIIMVI